MYWWKVLVLISFCGIIAKAAIIPDDDIDQQGLYSKSDHVTILTNKNFDKKIYGQRNAFLIQFYNSYCGHCRAFAPKYKSLAAELEPWKTILKVAVLDCSIEENNEICRQFEVMAYPSLRYLHENYLKGNANVGDKLRTTDSAENLKIQIINKMQNEQTMGRLDFAPALNIASYTKFTDALSNIPKDTIYTFLVFEADNSTTGSELALDVNKYEHIKVKRVYDTSELAEVAGVRHFPGLVAVGTNMEPVVLNPNIPKKQDLLKALNTFLKLRNYKFPLGHISNEDTTNNLHQDGVKSYDTDVVYYSDLEKTLKTSLHTEITRHKILNNEPLQALIEYLNVLILAYPFRGNLKEYIVDLRDNLKMRNQWSGSDVYELVNRLEATHAPVFDVDLDYVRCKGSRAGYRLKVIKMLKVASIILLSALSIVTGEDEIELNEKGCPVDLSIFKTVPHEACSKFYLCANGEPVEFTCPDGLMYNDENGVCDWPNQVDCEIRVKTLEPVTDEKPYDPTNTCASEDSDGLLLPHQYCNHLYMCSHGVAIDMTCPEPLLFNADLKLCDWETQMDCGNRLREKISQEE